MTEYPLQSNSMIPRCVQYIGYVPVITAFNDLWPLLLTWFKFNPSVDK